PKVTVPARPAPAPAETPRGESSSTQPPAADNAATTNTDTAPPPPPPPPHAITTARSTPRTADENSRDQFTITSHVNFVVVPVTVKDNGGRMVDGLLRRDFAVYEDGTPQSIQLFTSDP